MPALQKLKLVIELELRGRGDIQLFRVEVPGPKVTRDIASDAKVRLSVPRSHFNELAKEGKAGTGARRSSPGTVKASGPAEILKLIQNVIEKQEERLGRASSGRNEDADAGRVGAARAHDHVLACARGDVAGALAGAEVEHAAVVNAIAAFEPVMIVVDPAGGARRAGCAAAVEVVERRSTTPGRATRARSSSSTAKAARRRAVRLQRLGREVHALRRRCAFAARVLEHLGEHASTRRT